MEIQVCSPRGNEYKNTVIRKRIEAATMFFLKLLKLHLKDGLVRIHICKKLPGGAYGDCEFVEDTNTVIIRVRSWDDTPEGVLGKDECLIGILSHELVHAKQFYQGRLQELEDGTYWSYTHQVNPKVFKYDFKKHARLESKASIEAATDLESPWEVEAYAVASILTRAWLTYGRKEYDNQKEEL